VNALFHSSRVLTSAHDRWLTIARGMSAAERSWDGRGDMPVMEHCRDERMKLVQWQAGDCCCCCCWTVEDRWWWWWCLE